MGNEIVHSLPKGRGKVHDFYSSRCVPSPDYHVFNHCFHFYGSGWASGSGQRSSVCLHRSDSPGGSRLDRWVRWLRLNSFFKIL